MPQLSLCSTKFPSTAIIYIDVCVKEALQHGDAGLDLVIQALQNEVTQVRWAAYSLLGQRKESRIKQAVGKKLLKCGDWLKDNITIAGIVNNSAKPFLKQGWTGYTRSRQL